MGTIPTISTFTAGAVLTAAQLNGIKSAIDFWALTPRCYAYATGTITLTTATYTVVPLGAEVFDIVQSGDSPSHDNTTNNSRIYARTSGKYQISGQVTYAANATGARYIVIKKNAAGAIGSGTDLYSKATAAASTSTSVDAATIEVDLTAGDYIEMFGYQSSGGNLNVNTSSGAADSFLRMALSGT